MSPSWRERYRYGVALGPDRLLAVRRRAGLRPGVDLKLAESFPAQADGPMWKPAVEALERFARHPRVQAGNLRLLLSDHFVRYLLVPWSELIVNAGEFRNYVAAAFADVYGEVSAEWVLRASPERSGAPRLAAGVDRALLEAVRDVIGRSRLQLTSVQPHLMAAYNRFARRRRNADFVFVTVEAGRLCVLAARGGTWAYVSAASIPEGSPHLAQSLEREIRLAGLGEEAPVVLVHAAQSSSPELPALLGMAPRVLSWKPPRGLAPATDAEFALPALVV